jgi:RNA polymerase sigma-70 factor (ECF subfamily)
VLVRAQARDSAAWSEIVRLYAPLIAFWCRRCGLNSHDAADCIQEVFSALAGSLSTYEPRAANGGFRAWLWTITRNKVRDFYRRKLRQWPARGGSSAQELIGEVPDPASIPEDEPSDAVQLNELIRRGLELVRAEFESTTWLSFWRSAVDGIPTAVVAEQLGLTSAAVRQNRSRIMRRLRQQLGDLR